MRFAPTLLRISLLLPLVAGCASSPQQQQDDAARERAFKFSGGDELAQRATFDLHCPVQQMEAQVLQRVGMFAVAASAGVRGCGLQASYVRSAGTGGAWVLNGGVAADPTARQPAPPPPPPAGY
jgi:hypothetical protein